MNSLDKIKHLYILYWEQRSETQTAHMDHDCNFTKYSLNSCCPKFLIAHFIDKKKGIQNKLADTTDTLSDSATTTAGSYELLQK